MPHSNQDGNALSHQERFADDSEDSCDSTHQHPQAVDFLAEDSVGERVDETVDATVEATVDATVDARGHRCPMPLLMAKRGLNALTVGQTLCLLATDPGSRRDFEIFARQSGHELLHTKEQGGEFRCTPRKR
jgi:tRNA 2-thiouridine synthesizing protein A